MKLCRSSAGKSHDLLVTWSDEKVKERGIDLEAVEWNTEVSDLTEMSPSVNQLSMRRRNTTCARPIDRSTIIAIENRGRHLIAGRKGMSCDPFLEMFFETEGSRAAAHLRKVKNDGHE